MLDAARLHHPLIAPAVCGPLNAGNYLAAHQIPATCGFDVTYEHLHAPNERIKLDTVQMTHQAYPRPRAPPGSYNRITRHLSQLGAMIGGPTMTASLLLHRSMWDADTANAVCQRRATATCGL
jgi:hypothetical protein